MALGSVKSKTCIILQETTIIYRTIASPIESTIVNDIIAKTILRGNFGDRLELVWVTFI